ncbi:MAG: hypothetical protein J7500_10115 [Sphingomonas sp.]|uniref:hypothetical protein n=1 Tax=Sphingomonas sp. TaxID=28214 RepID=UPI001B1C073D|nr:hypothetical protein [Sphingomonas sp.]MBO9623052.1 hypothetical protein [Sphingomonas sp.]
MEQGSDPLVSPIARRVLEHLVDWWPAPRDADALAFGLTGPDGDRHLLTVMEALCDAGLVMYEAIVMRDGAPCFRDTVITQSGFAALQAMQRRHPGRG